MGEDSSRVDKLGDKVTNYRESQIRMEGKIDTLNEKMNTLLHDEVVTKKNFCGLWESSYKKHQSTQAKIAKGVILFILTVTTTLMTIVATLPSFID